MLRLQGPNRTILKISSFWPAQSGFFLKLKLQRRIQKVRGRGEAKSWNQTVSLVTIFFLIFTEARGPRSACRLVRIHYWVSLFSAGVLSYLWQCQRIQVTNWNSSIRDIKRRRVQASNSSISCRRSSSFLTWSAEELATSATSPSKSSNSPSSRSRSSSLELNTGLKKNNQLQHTT